MSISVQFDKEKFEEYLVQQRKQFKDVAPLMRDIAVLIESQSRKTFETERDTTGKLWKPSQRKIKKGGKTLTDSGHLGDSITSSFGNSFFRTGSKRKYAAVHQLGGLFKQNVPAYARTMTQAWGRKVKPFKQYVKAHRRVINMPRRSFMPRGSEELEWDKINKLIDLHIMRVV